MMLRLSFIVPFYNVELYIEECILSLYNQDIPWDEYEVICIDDCSPDGSRKIVEKLQAEYPTLKLLTTPENLRQGGARNMGLDIARGKYVWFVDSDDYIKPNCLKRLLKQAEEEDLDILDFDFDSDFSKQAFIKNEKSFDSGICSGADYVFSKEYGGRWSWRCSCVCGGVVKYNLIKELRFREKVQYEDNDFALIMYARANRLHHIEEKPYYYRVVESSTVNRKVTLVQLVYNVELLSLYMQLHNSDNGFDIRFHEGIKDLIKYTAVQLIRQLKLLPKSERKTFYDKKMANISGLKSFLGKKVWLSLNYDIIRKIIY